MTSEIVTEATVTGEFVAFSIPRQHLMGWVDHGELIGGKISDPSIQNGAEVVTGMFDDTRTRTRDLKAWIRQGQRIGGRVVDSYRRLYEGEDIPPHIAGNVEFSEVAGRLEIPSYRASRTWLELIAFNAIAEQRYGEAQGKTQSLRTGNTLNLVSISRYLSDIATGKVRLPAVGPGSLGDFGRSTLEALVDERLGQRNETSVSPSKTNGHP